MNKVGWFIQIMQAQEDEIEKQRQIIRRLRLLLTDHHDGSNIDTLARMLPGDRCPICAPFIFLPEYGYYGDNEEGKA